MAETVQASRTRPRPPTLSRVLAPFTWKFAVLAEVLALLLIWHVIQGMIGVWDRRFVPAPGDVIRALSDLYQTGDLMGHLTYSASNAAVGFVLAVVVGVPVGLLLGSSRWAYDIGGPPFWAMYSMPRIAFQPLLVLWMGFGSGPKIFIVFLMAVFPIAINTMDGIRGVDRSLVKAARVYGAGPVDVFFKVQLWAALPLILTGIRMGVARSMIGVVIGEFIGGSQGLGFLIYRKSGEFELDAAVGVTFLLVAIALVGMALVNLAKRVFASWYVEGAPQS
ncbi:ABC transporter permease [Phytoactinopolyspora limicola]|uniref:ABC transporter permease n=1 Tax=Phytoactinopolyspora limicola TaxID=2715536 RepID=UPI00140B3A17|nr:ABC transporter permease [Phytoactinopolyspora limicola]